MQALDILDSPLQWETERQNRIHKEALELRRKQARDEPMRNETAADDPASPIIRAAQFSKAAVVDAASLRSEWIDKVLRIPRMRSALIPLDDEKEGAEWSKPFSLLKADIEPLASFFSGYRQSRLFMDGGDAEPQLDFTVRALLDLKKVSHKIVLDPPVQIDAQIEFHNLEEELCDCRDHVRARNLIKFAQNVHDKQLEQAVVRGREMGNALHDALMGEGHGNLIHAWTQKHKRKPTVQELHLLLTKGKITADNRRPAAVAAPVMERSTRPVVEMARKEAPPAPWVEPVAQVVQPKQAAVQPVHARPVTAIPDVAGEVESEEVAKKVAASRIRQLLMYGLHATVGTAALIAYAWYF
ncbi:hypothetical protein [Noviherbaspirillum sp. Root189]|uniref:hypothetical protein n=1 Tax=Noviherbaspirillum sp. Root189 TaxID=1736487 RepID=UPI00070FA41B|nr:hypothetical protein [Noviherbaspirillum sp. Root189]